MQRILLIVLGVGLFFLGAGCGGSGEEKDPVDNTGGPPGWFVRATSPSGLVADPLLVPGASEVALTAFYGSPLKYLGYVELTGETSRVFIGPAGADNGSDPPFGINKAGAIVAEKTDQVASCVLLDANPRSSLAVEWTPGGAEGFLAFAAVTADKVTKVWEDQGVGVAPKKLVGGAGAIFPRSDMSQVLLKYESSTGKLLSVMPTKARASRGSGYQIIDSGDGQLQLRGEFVGIYDTAVGRDLAPGGAQVVTIEKVTKKTLAVE